MRRPGRLLVTVFILVAGFGNASAQEPQPRDTTAMDPTAVDTVAPPLGPRAPAPVDTTASGPSPRSALLKSLVVPGWGQMSVGSYVRGGIYMAIGATSWGMLGKTIHKLGEAEDRREMAVAAAVDSLIALVRQDSTVAEALRNPADFRAAVLADSLVAHRTNLVDARRQQRQDWIAYTMFFTFLNGLDAYVAAHLTDFPAELDVERRADGGVAVGVRLALPARRDE